MKAPTARRRAWWEDDDVRKPDWPVPQREAEFLSTACDELPILALADDVSRLLADVIQRVNVPPREGEPDAVDARRHALWFMAIIAFRAMRAAMQSLSIGYEDQAVGFQRLIDELHNRAQKVWQDTSGDYARHWLSGRGQAKGAKLAGQDFWEFMSGPVHANARAVLDWIAISQDDGSTKIVIGPERRPEVANAALAYMAGEGRDLAGMLALEAGLVLDLGELDRRVRSAHAAYIPDSADVAGRGESTMAAED
jgi:hypothetical protein